MRKSLSLTQAPADNVPHQLMSFAVLQSKALDHYRQISILITHTIGHWTDRPEPKPSILKGAGARVKFPCHYRKILPLN